MEGLICQRCRAPLDWDGQSEIVQCAYCGIKYRMHPRGRENTMNRGVSIGSGTVEGIQTTHGRYAGHALVKSYIPKGWHVETNAPEQASDMLCPLTIQAVFSSPSQDACITFTGTRAYRHLEPTPQNAQMQGQMIMPDRVVALSYRDAGTVCDGIISANPAIRDVRMIAAADTPDAWASNLIRKRMQECLNVGMQEPGGNWAQKHVTARDAAGQTWHKVVEAMVTYAYVPVSQVEQMTYQMAMQSQRSLQLNTMFATRGRFAGLLAGMSQPKIQPPMPKMSWIVQYILETSAHESLIREAMDYHRKIRESIEVLPLFESESARIRDALYMQAQRDNDTINNAMAQMNRDRMASWDRRQQIMRDASDYGTNVMHQMFEDNARTNQRVANMHSEAIRGVNSYYTANPGFGVPPVVEADVRWDHVYQNTQHPDYFAAHEGHAPFEFGVDYEELKRTNGDY